MIPTQQAALLGLDDAALVARVRNTIADVDDLDVMDAIYSGLDELLERFAPDVNKQAIWRELGDEHSGDSAGRIREMDVMLAGIQERVLLRPLARALEG